MFRRISFAVRLLHQIPRLNAALFFSCGVIVGGSAVALFAQNPQPPAFGAVNHVGIAVQNWDDAMRFYSSTLGLKQAWMLKDEAGAPALAYFQTSRNTFIELQPVTADRPAGISHVGVEVPNMDAAVKALQARGLTVTEPRVGRAGAPIANVTMPGGVRFELVQITPTSLQRKAIDEWRDAR